MRRYKINISQNGIILKSKKGLISNSIEKFIESTSEWDAAHKYFDEVSNITNSISYIEPEIANAIFSEENEIGLTFKSGPDGYLSHWPKPKQKVDSFVWHLGLENSQLAAARDKVWQNVGIEKCIKIAHIDTGYQEGHPSLPIFLHPGISFIDGEIGNPAIDKLNNSFQEQQGHGTATMSLLAGGNIKSGDTNGKFDGTFGAIPFAEILPIRICDTVALFRSNSFVRAVEYAITQRCEVISMSMAGAPTREWADAVNKAYEAGIVLVTAAGNSWIEGIQKLLPKRLLYPARWDRVIAATGVAADHNPYVFEAPKFQIKSAGGETMQGNYGPEKAMKNALAAYTPNVSWATMNQAEKHSYFRLDGGGTSSATPQIAAAAALWISYHRKRIDELVGTEPHNKWKKVEAVKYALFETANRDYPEWEKYLGKGSLKALDALEKFPLDKDLKKASEAKVSLDGILDLLGILFRVKSKESISIPDSIKNEMFTTELIQVIHNEPELNFLLDYDEDQIWSPEDKDKMKLILLNSPKASNALKEKIRVI